MAESILEMVQHLKYENFQQKALVVDISEWTVFEVPARLRASSPASFENKGLELGLHHRTLKKSQTEVFKVDIARILHSKLATRNSSWDRFAHEVVGDVNRARQAYSESSAKFNDEEVENLLALDALFIVVLFKYVNCSGFFLKEFVALAGRLTKILTMIDKTDFFLIENQVPMYLLHSVIRHLCEIDEETEARRLELKVENIDEETEAGRQKRETEARRREMKVEDELEKVLNEAVLLLNPFTYPETTRKVHSHGSHAQNSRDRLHQHLISTYPVVPLERSLINCQHLLDCLYRVICGHSLPFKVEQGVKSNLTLENIPSATRLEAVGIRVVGAVATVNEIRLRGSGYLRRASLQLPKVALYDYSESAFHNLALHEEVTSAGVCGDLRCYLQCMASLCLNVSDVQVLSEHGVINNHMGNDKVLGMWDRTLRGVFTPFPSSSWVRLYRDIHQHRNARLKRWRQECWALFFAKPWTLVSVLAGFVLLFLTATQAWFTVFPPKKRRLH